jgi:hypothetical protein
MRRADLSYRGVLPTEVRRCVWSRNLKTDAIASFVSERHRDERKIKPLDTNLELFNLIRI